MTKKKPSKMILDGREDPRARGGAIEPERPQPAPLEKIPPLMVQRMGRRFRIAYKENRNLARFNSGEAVDGGGFDDQGEAMIYLSKITAGATFTDPEEERVE